MIAATRERVENEVSDSRDLLLGRIASRLHELFDGLIGLSDVATKPDKEREAFFLTRSLAALALLDEAEIKPDQAAECVTDGGADDGIDGVFVDEKEKIIYFVQSKWRSGAGGVQLKDFTRFRAGVKDVITLNWNQDNANLHVQREKIETGLKDIDTRIVMLLVILQTSRLLRTSGLELETFLLNRISIWQTF
jgi:hypothetical protein